MGNPTDSYVQGAADGVGKKVATQQTTRSDGTAVEQQEVVPIDPQTGRAQPAPPWEALDMLLRAVLVELRVLNFVMAEESRTDTRIMDETREHFARELEQ